MISGWNRFICRNNVSNRMNMNMNLYTGGGGEYRLSGRLYAPCAAGNLRPTASRRNTAVLIAGATPTGTARTIMSVRRERRKPCAPSAA